MSHNFIKLFSDSLQLNSENIFLKKNQTQISFKQFKAFVKKTSLSLQKRNLSPGDLVLIDIRNPFYFAANVFACLHLKLKPALLNSYFKKSQIDSILSDNSYRLLITDQEHEDINLPTQHLDSDLPIEYEEGPLDIELDSEVLFFTSGSVQSKACVLTLNNFFYNALGSSENIPFTQNDIWGLSLPLFHVGGFSLLIRGILAQAQIYILDNNQKNYQEQFEKFNVTHISFVSTQFVRFLDQANKDSSIKHILLGGSAIPVTALAQAVKLNLPIYKSYGMTEMASQICTTKKITDSQELHFSGHLLNFRELKIQDQKIFVRGPCLFKGYLKNNQLEIITDSEGWFFTKDFGTEYDGKIKILGRSDRVFQSAGESISPETIEQELLKLPGISKAFVCPEKDLEYGFRAVAYIEKEQDLNDETIMKFLESKLSGFYRPKALRPWNESPKISWKQ